MTEAWFRQLYSSMGNALMAAFHMHQRSLSGYQAFVCDKDDNNTSDVTIDGIERVLYEVVLLDSPEFKTESIGFLYKLGEGELDLSRVVIYQDRCDEQPEGRVILPDFKVFEEKVRLNIANIIDMIPVVEDVGFYRA